MKQAKIECASCKSEFFYQIGDADERCPRCQLMWGRDVEKILVEMKKQNFAGQEHVIHVLGILAAKIKSLSPGVAVEKSNG